MNAIFIGTISGLLVNLIIYLFKKHALPIIHSIEKVSINISGDWQALDNRSNSESVIKFKQYGTKIDAILLRKTPQNSRTFIYTGSIKNGRICLTWYEKGAKDYNYGSMYLAINNTRNELYGKNIYYHNDEHQFLVEEKHFNKVET